MNRYAKGMAAAFAALLALAATLPGRAAEPAPASPAIATVLRMPLPPEELQFTDGGDAFVVAGPTFTYHVAKATGAIAALQVMREGQEVLRTTAPVDLQIDRYRLTAPENALQTTVVSADKDKVVLKTAGALRDPEQHGPNLACELVHTFFNDGVVVSAVQLTPSADLAIAKRIVYSAPIQGQFDTYLHKRRDEHGGGAARGDLPAVGKSMAFSTLTSCLQVFSPTAALALFTDGGALHVSAKDMSTAAIEVIGREGNVVQAVLTQYIVHARADGAPYVLKAGAPLTFRVGLSVAPNRRPHPRRHDLRMFTWAGDAKNPYPTDAEIAAVARMGYTLFQMHRPGTPGEPRPPAGEIDRVVKTVHDRGMLFLWEENPDLLYIHAPGVKKLQAEGKWALWQGFNYGGHYVASMDPYCDLVATCLAAPNGQAEYRLANLERMLNALPVDGLFLDDNLAYANCTLWKEHGHPRPVYDCLIELHEMNWRRRQLMRSKCPHLVLVSHNSGGFVLPVVCDFDAEIYGEGYSFGAVEDYWRRFVALPHSLFAQPMIWPGDDEPDRCPVSLAYNYDLLTGGGQYTQLDWRIFAQKFPYAKGVTPRERTYAGFYNLAQYYFGLYESRFFGFATAAELFGATAPHTYAAVYHNAVWNAWLIPLVNMGKEAAETSLLMRTPQALGFTAEREYVVFDVQQRRVRHVPGTNVDAALAGVAVPGQNLRLFCVRQAPAAGPYHLWGGKQRTAVWNSAARKLTLTLSGPAGLTDTVFLSAGGQAVRQVTVAGRPAAFALDPAQGIVHGQVTFGATPVTLEVECAAEGGSRLPMQPVAPVSF